MQVLLRALLQSAQSVPNTSTGYALGSAREPSMPLADPLPGSSGNTCEKVLSKPRGG